MNRNYKLLDVVALLKDIPEKKLRIGQVGTIVEILDKNVFEVEFCDSKGQTLITLGLKNKELLLLHYDLMAA